MLKFYTYKLVDPRDDHPFYIGKGTKQSGKYFRRLEEHLKDCKHAQKGLINYTYKIRKILSMLANNIKPVFEIIEESDDEEFIKQKEISLIAFYGRKDIGTGILCNHTNGGDGMIGYKHSVAHRANLKIDNKGGQATAISVAQICIESGRIIKIHDSARQAGLELTDKKEARANINNACKHKSVAPYGYYWRYASDSDLNDGLLLNVSELNEQRNRAKGAKNIIQIDENDEIIKTWNSASDACRYYKLHISTLNVPLKKGTKSQGYYWKYA